jgi:hypothetical protein
MQRIQIAYSKNPDLIRELSECYIASGRMLKLWKEIASIRRAFIDNYDSLQPLLQISYWRDELQDINCFVLSTKQFDKMRQLYIDTFETLCRLLVIATVVESIIQNGIIDLISIIKLFQSKSMSPFQMRKSEKCSSI